ncbi:MAG TPA: Uma2 family endonuclease [Pirellulales bacterium]|nr:Uma2 family endonuclease [Pirellulales bacterium]
MATVEQTKTRESTAPIVLCGVPWNLYEQLREIEANWHVRMTYNHGSLELMAPSARHEDYARLIERMIHAIAEELDMPIRSLGSTTWKQRAEMAGLEADGCYFILNAAAVVGRDANDLQREESPDLAVEVEITRSVETKLPLYAALGVAEIWRYDGSALESWRLGPDVQYAQAERSLNLPFLKPADLEPFLEANHDDETRWIKGFRQWVREQFRPGKAGP